jgi:4-amino-4-deoxy-L-arabinose transferase-like glycosyltransferase
MPLAQDEAVYSIMIAEQQAHPTLIPTFLGHPVGWKPPLFFWAYAAFPRLPLPLEASLRLPSLLFGLASIPLLYSFMRNTGCSKNVTFLSGIIFMSSFLSSYPQTALLLDSMLFFLICGSLYAYSSEKSGRWRFLAAGALAFAAFFTKMAVAFIIPVLAIAYFYTKRRETLREPLFLLSLLAVPLAAVLNFGLFQGAALGDELYGAYTIGQLVSANGLIGQLEAFGGSFLLFLPAAGIWFMLSLAGLARHYKDNPMMACWYLFLAFPLMSSAYKPWYFLAVMPPIAYFAAMALLMWKGKERADALFAFAFAATLLGSAALSVMIYPPLYDAYVPQREAGLLLSGKENVLVVGAFAPGIIAYKMLPEAANGTIKDMGWAILPQNASDAVAAEFIRDYYTAKYPVVDGSFTSMYGAWDSAYRKDTSIARFDYIAVVEKNAVPEGGRIIYNKNNITVFSMAR